MRVRVLFFSALLWSGCFLTGYETHEREDGSVDQMDAGRDGATMDAQVIGDAATDAEMDGTIACEVQPSACGPITPCIDATCNCDGPISAMFDAGPTVNPLSYDCTFTCGGAGGCRTFCRPGEVCQTLCLNSPNCRSTCLGGSSCDMSCATNCRSDCLEGAICNYRCIGGPCADVRCDQGAQCTMRCPDNDLAKCAMRCDTGLKACPDSGVVVCGTTCP